MDKARAAHAVSAEVRAAADRLASALNDLAGPWGVQYRSCVSDLYFACFHMTCALLASKALRPNSHDAAQELLSLHFVKTGALPADTAKRLNALMERRHTADYKSVIPVDESDVAEFRPWVAKFMRAALALLGKSVAPADGAHLKKLIEALERR
jgi:uncharacterized protein (UPF0332 family)